MGHLERVCWSPHTGQCCADLRGGGAFVGAFRERSGRGEDGLVDGVGACDGDGVTETRLELPRSSFLWRSINFEKESMSGRASEDLNRSHSRLHSGVIIFTVDMERKAPKESPTREQNLLYGKTMFSYICSITGKVSSQDETDLIFEMIRGTRTSGAPKTDSRRFSISSRDMSSDGKL